MLITTTETEERLAQGDVSAIDAIGSADSAPAVAGAVAEPLEKRVLLAVTNPGGPVIMYESFADGSFRGWTPDIEGSGTITRVTKPSAPTRVGNESGRFTLP